MVLVDEQEGQKRRLQTKTEESFLMKYVFKAVQVAIPLGELKLK
jgi:hypothetical protein